MLWRNALNWDCRGGTYCAARGLRTTHGVVHVQRAGLQATTKHGVFHSLGAPPRSGYRVALTARITFPDAAARVERFVEQKAYRAHFGPTGEWWLPRAPTR